MANIKWANVTGINPKGYVCGHCNFHVASNAGYFYSGNDGAKIRHIYICPKCDHPTYFVIDPELAEEEFQIPSPLFGENVKNLPDDIEELYNEARRCLAVSAYTSAVMLCRILLMHIAVEKGAKEKLTFQEYVDWLEENGYIPRRGKPLVEHVRDRGNKANHKIHLMKHQDAHNLIIFVGMLMKFVYEYPSLIPQPASDSQNKTVSSYL